MLRKQTLKLCVNIAMFAISKMGAYYSAVDCYSFPSHQIPQNLSPDDTGII